MRERGTRHKLPFAVVSVQDAAGAALGGADADAEGRFSVEIAAPGPGKVRVTVSAADHATATFDEALAPGTKVEVVYHLDPLLRARYRTVVYGERREEVARSVLSAEEVRTMPGTRGDALRAVTNLPGIARAPFDTGQLVIWGAAPGDSRVLVRGHGIPLAFHFGLGSSVFNSDLLERIEYVPGNFGVRYGRATGGIIDIAPRAGSREGWHGYAKLDFVDAGLMLEGPVGKGSFAIAARRSLVDAALAIASSWVDLGFLRAPTYWDYQAVFDYPLLGGHLKLLVYGSDDTLALVINDAPDSDPAIRGRLETRIWFHAASLGWTRRWGRFEIEAITSAGPQHTSFGLGTDIGYNLDVVEWDTRIEGRYRVSDRFRLVAGIDLAVDWFRVRVSAPYVAPEGEYQPPTSVQDKRTTENGGWEANPAAYLEARLQPARRLTITPGVRADHFAGQRATVDPRLTVRLEVAPRTWLLGGVGLFHQASPAPFADPKLGNPRLRPQEAVHLSLGIESRPLPRLPSLYGRLTGFYKDLRYLASTSDQWIIRDGKAVPELYSDSGVGRVYGMELQLRQDDLSRRVWGLLSYTLMRSERRDHPGDPWRPFQFDQTHILALVVGAHLWWGIDLGARFRFVSGNPDTPFRGAVYASDFDVHVPLPGPVFSIREPDFIQLDLRLDRKFLFNRWWIAIYIDVSNVTNRQNVDGYAYSYDYRKRAPVTGLPVFPSLGVKAAF